MAHLILIDQAPPSLTYITNANQDTSGTSPSSVTFSGISFGAARSDRRIIVTLGCAATTDPTALTVGGFAGTLLVRATNSYCADIWIADVPTGTSGSIVFSGGSAINYTGIGVYSATGLISSTPTNTASGTVGDLSFSIDIPALGICVGSAFSGGGGPTPAGTWTGLTKDFGGAITGFANSVYSGAHYTGTPPVTGLSITVDLPNFSATQGCAASFR